MECRGIPPTSAQGELCGAAMMMMMRISIKHSVGLWAIYLWLSIFTWEAAPTMPIRWIESAVYNPPLHLIAFLYSQLTSWYCFSKRVLRMKSTAFFVYGGWVNIFVHSTTPCGAASLLQTNDAESSRITWESWLHKLHALLVIIGWELSLEISGVWGYGVVKMYQLIAALAAAWRPCTWSLQQFRLARLP